MSRWPLPSPATRFDAAEQNTSFLGPLLDDTLGAPLTAPLGAAPPVPVSTWCLGWPEPPPHMLVVITSLAWTAALLLYANATTPPSAEIAGRLELPIS